MAAESVNTGGVGNPDAFPEVGKGFQDVLDTAIQGSADLQSFAGKFEYDSMFRRAGETGGYGTGDVGGLYGTSGSGNPYMEGVGGWRDTPGKDITPAMGDMSKPEAVLSQMRQVNDQYIDAQQQYANLSIKLHTTSAIAEVMSNFVKGFRTLFQGQ